MGKKVRFSKVAGWFSLGLGVLLSIPWVPVALVAWIQGGTLSIPVLALVGLGVPLVLGLFLLGRARGWLAQQAMLLSRVYWILGVLWAIAGPMSVLNFRYTRVFLAGGSGHPLALLVIGALPAVVGVAYLAQAAKTWLPGREQSRRWAGWAYLAVAALLVTWGLVVLVQGEPFTLISALTQASLMVLMSAALFERRTQSMGALFVTLALSIALLFLPGVERGQLSTFVLNPGGNMAVWSVQPVILPTGVTVALLVTLAAGLGLWQSMRERGRATWAVGGVLGLGVLLFLIPLGANVGLSTGLFMLIVLALALGMAAWQILRTEQTNGVLGAILFLFIFAFLIWASRDKAFNFTGILINMLGAATPIALGALSGVWCERSAVINIAIEGMMLSAAFTSVVVGSATGSLLLALLVGMLTGGLLSALLAVLAIRFKVDQIIAGTAINIFAVGATSFLSARLLVERQELNASDHFLPIALPVLSRIPVIGPVLFQNNLIIYLMLVLVGVTHLVLFYTRWGLRSRAVGEHPMAADTLGVNVFFTRYVNVFIGGLVAGLGGSYFTIGSVGRFDEVMTAGRGFIGLAAMIFGRWNPFGAFGSSLIFGFADASAAKLGILKVPIPSHFLLMAPYLATIIVLAGVVGRAVPPAADGQVYEKH